LFVQSMSFVQLAARALPVVAKTQQRAARIDHLIEIARPFMPSLR